MGKGLVINGRFLSQTVTGVQRSALELSTLLIDLVPDIKFIVPQNTSCDDAAITDRSVFLGRLQGTLWEQTELAAYMRRHGGVLLNLCNTAPLAWSRNIVMIHDLGVFENPAWYSDRFARWYRFLTPRILRKALMVLTVSEFSKNELVRRFGIPDEKVHVVHNHVPLALLPGSPVPKENLILHVGSFTDRKNVSFIIEAFRNAGRKDLRLVLCGSEQPDLSNRSTVTRNDENISVLTGVDDRGLRELYAKAGYIVCASHYEGFGMPVLEGIAHGANPILSDIPVFKELYPEGPIYFSPLRRTELEQIFTSLPDEYTDAMPEARRRYMRAFDPSRTEQTLAQLIQGLHLHD